MSDHPLIQVTHALNLLQNHREKECVMLGRSNAGKSTMINRIMGRTVAKVSSAPGKTRTLNLYHAQDKYWVDLPGVGYARASHSILADMKQRVKDYVDHRGELSLVIHCMDIRHPWLAWDEALWELYNPHVPALWILTKADKLSRQRAKNALQAVQKFRPGNYLTMGLKDDMGVFWGTVNRLLSESSDE